MFDYHIHTKVSFDSREGPENVIRVAKERGLKEICFTDHIDDDPRGITLDQRFTIEQYSAAYDHLDCRGIKVRFGMEFGLLADNQASFQRHLDQRKFDFVLGSIHYADGVDVYFPPYWEGKTLFQAERKYLEDTLTCVQSHDGFDVLGHLTYLSKSPSHPTHDLIVMQQHREIVDEILKELACKGKGLEVNTSGVDCCGGFLPEVEYLRRFKELGGQIVTVGSDAHDASRVGQYTDRACEMLKDIFGHVCTFEGRKPIFHKL